MSVLLVRDDGKLHHHLVDAAPGSRQPFRMRQLDDWDCIGAEIRRRRPVAVVLRMRSAETNRVGEVCERLRSDHPQASLGIVVGASGLPIGEEHRVLLRGADLCFHTELLETGQLLRGILQLVSRPAEYDSSRLCQGGIVLDRRRRTIRVRNREIPVTQMQLEILWRMAEDPGRFFSPRELLDFATSSAEARRVIYLHICRLRKQLGPDRGLIETGWQQGYRIRPE